MNAGSSKTTAKSGYVQRLNNHFQGGNQQASGVVYSFKEGAGDKFTATVTLPNNKSYSGTAVGKHAAKEEAAYNAFNSL